MKTTFNLCILLITLFFTVSCNYNVENPANETAGTKNGQTLKTANNDTVILKNADGTEQVLTPEEISYELISSLVLIPYCIQCHSDTNQKAGVNFSSFGNTLKYIQPNNPIDSRLYIRMSDGSMPPSGNLSPNADEIKLVEIWINNGAIETLGAPQQQAKLIPPKSPPTDSSNLTFTDIKDQVLKSYCLKCHGQNNRATKKTNTKAPLLEEYSQVMAFVTVGQPESSTLYTEVKSGSMPPNHDDITRQQQNEILRIIQKWILAGAPPSNTPKKPKSPPPKQQTELPKETVTFQTVLKKIFQPHCIRCHSDEESFGWIDDFSNYQQVLKNVKIDNAKDSKLYTQIKSGAMPEDTSLTPEQIEEALILIEEWINNGSEQ